MFILNCYITTLTNQSIRNALNDCSSFLHLFAPQLVAALNLKPQTFNICMQALKRLLGSTSASACVWAEEVLVHNRSATHQIFFCAQLLDNGINCTFTFECVGASRNCEMT